MAYKQKGCTPVTAKIQKSTKGGMVQQPLLNMGAPVKMKMTSPAKQTGDPFGAAYQKKRAEKKQAKEKASAQSDMAKYKEDLSRYKKDAKSVKSIPEYNRGPIEGRMSRFEKQYGTRMRGEEGWAADDAKRRANPGATVETKPKQKMAKAGTAARKAQYDAKGWKYDETISGHTKGGRKVQKTTSTIKPKAAKVKAAKVKAAKVKAPKIEAKSITIDTKAPSTKKEARQVQRADRKEDRQNKRAARKTKREARKAYRAGDITKQEKKAAVAKKKKSC